MACIQDSKYDEGSVSSYLIACSPGTRLEPLTIHTAMLYTVRGVDSCPILVYTLLYYLLYNVLNNVLHVVYYNYYNTFYYYIVHYVLCDKYYTSSVVFVVWLGGDSRL